MKKWIIILIAILIIGFIVFLIVNQKEKYFNHIVIENTNIFNTIKDKNYLDTIIYAGVKNLEIENLIIVIRPMKKEDVNKFLINNDLELKAHIQGMGDTYIIWLNPNESRSSYIEILSHELIHLKQYYTKELSIIDGVIYWRGDKININDYSYKERPWEIEAFSYQHKLERSMNDILYD